MVEAKHIDLRDILNSVTQTNAACYAVRITTARVHQQNIQTFFFCIVFFSSLLFFFHSSPACSTFIPSSASQPLNCSLARSLCALAKHILIKKQGTPIKLVIGLLAFCRCRCQCCTARRAKCCIVFQRNSEIGSQKCSRCTLSVSVALHQFIAKQFSVSCPMLTETQNGCAQTRRQLGRKFEFSHSLHRVDKTQKLCQIVFV